MKWVRLKQSSALISNEEGKKNTRHNEKVVSELSRFHKFSTKITNKTQWECACFSTFTSYLNARSCALNNHVINTKKKKLKKVNDSICLGCVCVSFHIWWARFCLVSSNDSQKCPFVITRRIALNWCSNGIWRQQDWFLKIKITIFKKCQEKKVNRNKENHQSSN